MNIRLKPCNQPKFMIYGASFVNVLFITFVVNFSILYISILKHFSQVIIINKMNSILFELSPVCQRDMLMAKAKYC